MIERIIRTFDIYGSPFTLRINGQNKFKSKTGGFFSLLTLGVLLMTIVYFGKNFYQRQNPKLSIEEGLYSNSEIPILDGSDYEDRYFVITYEQRLDSVIKPFTTKPVLDDKRIQIGFEQVFIPNCSKDFLLNKSIIKNEEDFLYSYYSFKCLKLNDFKIGAMSYDTSPLVINMQKCSEIEQSYLLKYNMTNCQSNYNDTIDYMPLTVWYDKIGFSPNSKSPFREKTVPTTHIISKDKINYVYFPISLYYLNDDLGWIFNSTEISFTFNFMNYNFVQYPSVGPDASYPQLNLVIYVSDDYKVFTRTYEKIQDLLAVIGGFMKIVFALLNILNLLIRAYLMDNYMVGMIFDQGETVNASHYKILAGIEKNTCVKGVNSVNKFILDPQINSRQDKSINSRLFLSSSKTGK
jgi:hypothetical protein